MKILLIHNKYGEKSGEETVVEGIQILLKANDHDVYYYSRTSEELVTMPFGNIRAFLSGIYNISSKKTIRNLLKEYKPDVIHIHNLFPLISPSILPMCKLAGIPVVMTVHNYRLVCPNGLHMVNGKICEKCIDGKEYWCVIKQCQGNIFKSIGYALRNFTARKMRFYLDNVTKYAALTKFQKNRLVNQGYNENLISIIPNIVENKTITMANLHGEYVGFVGRISPEKDVISLIKAAKKNSNIPFKAAGAYEQMPELLSKAPSNFDFLGFLNSQEINNFYDNSQIIVLCSICFEGFPMVLIEAMLHGKAIVCSNIGGLPEIVDDGVTGLLFEPGNVDDLSEKIQYLWDNPIVCKKMGLAGREKALREYSSEKYYKSLISLYEDAIKISSKENYTNNYENILGYPIITGDTISCVNKIYSWIKAGEKAKYFVCANPHSLVIAEQDLIFHDAIINADIITPDGSGIIIASKILKGQINKKISGSGVFRELSIKLNKHKKYKYFFLGSTDEILEKIKEKMAVEYPNIEVAGVYSPPFKTEFNNDDNKQMIEAINNAKPDVLWVGMTAPKQEKWIYQNKNHLDVKFIGPIGAVFDFFTGNIKRSHPFFLKTGLEWLPRLLKQPQRLWDRMFISAPKFLVRVFKQKFRMS